MEYAQATNIVGTSGSTVLVKGNAACVNLRSEFDQAVLDGRAYSWAGLTYDPDAHDTIIAVENNDYDHLLKIKQIIITSDAASLIQIFAASAVTMTVTGAVVGVNLNRGSGRLALATGGWDETGNGEQAGGYLRKFMQKQIAADTPYVIDVDGGIILPYDHMVGLDLTTAATAANGVVIGWFEPL